MISRAGQSPRLSQGAGPGLKATVQSVEREITSFFFNFTVDNQRRHSHQTKGGLEI